MRHFIFRVVALLVVFAVAVPALAEEQPIFKVPKEKAEELEAQEKAKGGGQDEDPAKGLIDDDGRAGRVPFWDQTYTEVNTLEFLLNEKA